jgi:hypothetical protein
MADVWDDNFVQFPRLLAEIAANLTFEQDQYNDLCAAMDLTEDQVDDLFDRASLEFERIKQGKAPRQVTPRAELEAFWKGEDSEASH